MPDWVDQAYEEYAKRICGECQLNLVPVAPIKRSNSNNPNSIKAKEAELISKKIPDNNHIVVLDENGKSHSTKSLSKKLSGWLAEGHDTSFIIGGADGLDASIINRANETLSLSAMTLPHGLARVMLAEQLYRALSILKNHPYHRE